jgi:hypothetical protein
MVAVRTSEVKETPVSFLVLSLYFVYVDLKQYTSLTFFEEQFGRIQNKACRLCGVCI